MMMMTITGMAEVDTGAMVHTAGAAPMVVDTAPTVDTAPMADMDPMGTLAAMDNRAPLL